MTDEAWHERLGWAHGLIAEDPAVRVAALVRLAAARQAVGSAITEFNGALSQANRSGAPEPYREPAVREALTRWREARSRSLPEALWQGVTPDAYATWPGLPYALLFLEWELRHPQAWTCHAKAWGTKESVIRELARAELDGPGRAKLADLVELAVRRRYRCKDREYVRIARAVDSPDLRERLAHASGSADPWARTHAGYVLHLLEHPELANSRRTWTDWLARGR
ncbi:hypothetical protein ACFVSN_00310 [Kitasatospora sp. NPDC057904]|uniref:hypothetical protein n=1 Tax=unclassified Kitasatospora TaxID=2633591 RepID=UPI0036DD545C